MIFESSQGILKIIASTFVVYFFLMFMCHIMDRRSIAKMTRFDWIITFTIGSAVGTALISNDVIILEVIFALSTLLLLHYLKDWFSVRSNLTNTPASDSPCVLYYQGEYKHPSMKKNGISQLDIESKVRCAGYADLCQVSAVIFEPNGNLSIIAAGQINDALIKKLIENSPH